MMTIITRGLVLGHNWHVSWFTLDDKGYRMYRRVYIHWYTGVDL